MSLDDWEGFDEWGTTQTDANSHGWNTTANAPSTPAGRFSGSAYRWPNNTNTTRVFPVAATRQTIGFAFRTNNAAASHTMLSMLEAGTEHARLAYNGNGTFTVSRAGTALGTTANLGIAANTWYYIELDYTCADSPNGAYELRVDGVNVSSGSGLDTRNGGASGTMDTLRVSQPNATATDWDDYYSASGSTSFQGDCRVITNVPTSDGTYTAWTPSTGTNHYAVVDEIPYNGDTDYISTAGAGNRDTFGFPALGVTGTVLGVQVQAIARKDDAGVRNLALVIDSNGTLSDGSSQALSASYTSYRRTDLQDPGAGPGAWTVTAVNAAQYGVKNV